MTWRPMPRPDRDERVAARAARLGALLVPGRAASMTGAVAGIPATKPAPARNRRLLDLAQGRPCLLRVPGVCTGGGADTVAAHSNLSIHGKAGARKADDQYSVWACAACHIGWLDQGSAQKAIKAERFMLAHAEQVLRWRWLAADPTTPDADRRACLWALDRLNATPVPENTTHGQ